MRLKQESFRREGGCNQDNTRGCERPWFSANKVSCEDVSLPSLHQLPGSNAFAHGQSALQGKARNLIFTHERNAGVRLSVDDELFEHLGARRAAGNAIVRAN